MSLRDNKVTKIVCKSADVADTCGLFLVVLTRYAVGVLSINTKNLGSHTGCWEQAIGVVPVRHNLLEHSEHHLFSLLAHIWDVVFWVLAQGLRIEISTAVGRDGHIEKIDAHPCNFDTDNWAMLYADFLVECGHVWPARWSVHIDAKKLSRRVGRGINTCCCVSHRVH